MMMKKSIVRCFILSIMTLGIYYWYWLAKLNNGFNLLAKDDYHTKGWIVLLLIVMTFGIYGYYWAYQQGHHYGIITQQADASHLFLMMQLMFAGLMILVLMQNTINDTLDQKTLCATH